MIFLQELTTEVAEHGTATSYLTFDNLWMFVAWVELILILYLLYKIKRPNENLEFSQIEKKRFKAKAKNSTIDMDGLMNNINGSKDLYKALSRKCHPDRFVNSDKYAIAEEIFQEISMNKRNYKALEELRDRAELKLEIKIL